MKLKLTLKIDHSVYGDGELHDVVAHILREAADKIERGAWTHSLSDTKGKKLGDVKVAFETNTKHLTSQPRAGGIRVSGSFIRKEP